MAKAKLPKDIKKKIGALVMCLVAYHDGKDVQALHFVDIFLITVFY
jgi:hypothetical protein